MTDEKTAERSGISRRSLIKKSAIVGGTAMWATPVVQSITNKAFAQAGSQGINGEISHFILVLQRTSDGAIFTQKYDHGDTNDSLCGVSGGSCGPYGGHNEHNPITPFAGAQPTAGCPTGSHTIAQANTNDVLVSINTGWSLVYFTVFDASQCFGPGEGPSGSGVTQPGGLPIGAGGSITILDPKPV